MEYETMREAKISFLSAQEKNEQDTKIWNEK